MRIMRYIAVFTTFFFFGLPITPSYSDFQPPHIAIFAAASTMDAVMDMATLYQAQGDKITLLFAGTPDLVRQIKQGVPDADAIFFLSADERWMDELDAAGLILPATRRRYLTTGLALIAPADSRWVVDNETLRPLPNLVGNDRLAMGEPNSVPAGRYAKAALQTLGLWNALKDHIAPTANVRAALTLVARGEAVAGIVYEADLRADIDHQIRLVTTIPPHTFPAPVYPIAALKPSFPAVAMGFETFLYAPKTIDIFEQHGFSVIKDHPNAQ